LKPGYLSQYFQGIAAKRLSNVEADILASNQHEFNGVEGLRALLGEPAGKVRYDAILLYLGEDDDATIVEEGSLTWYDARQKARLERGVMRWEYRLYFPTTRVSDVAAAGDLLVIGLQQDGRLLVIVATSGSSAANQITWLFGLGQATQQGFLVKSELDAEHDRVGFVSRLVLERIGIAVESTAPDYLAVLLDRFGPQFPSTKEFSAFARSTLANTAPLEAPDATLMAWMEREELLFRTLERYIIADHLAGGFKTASGDVDVDGFLQFSLSVQNRRKSRVGLAFENHLEVLLAAHGIRYARTAVTENRSKPDFLFPSAAEYHDAAFDPKRLTMLAVKSTCKDRWRQILAEADRIPEKHLLTLETAISRQQTDEMKEKGVRLVVPRRLHETFSTGQREWLIDVQEFISTVLRKQHLNARSVFATSAESAMCQELSDEPSRAARRRAARAA